MKIMPARSLLLDARAERAHQAELTTTALCDMLLGENALDRSDETLIRAVGLLSRVAVAARAVYDRTFVSAKDAAEAIED